MNVYAESEALGAQLFKWKKDNAPMIKDYKEFAVKSIEDIDKIETPDPKKDGKLMPATVKAVEILAPKCEKEKVPITVQPIPAFVLATDVGMVDMMKSFLGVKTNPEDMKRFIQKTKEIHIVFTEALVDAGADVVLYNLANAPEMGVEDYMKIDGFKYDKECIERDKKLGVHVITHSCSPKTRDFLNIFCDLGLEAISIGEMIPMKEARQIVGDKVALIGNVNQLTTLLRGTPEQAMEESRKCIEDGTDILCPGCGFGPRTPLANMKAMVEAAKKYGRMGRLAKG
jgi:MtaA/CmuA family methyltransferase